MRSFLAAVALALSSVVGVVLAVLALAPAALRHGPEGHRMPVAVRDRRRRPVAESSPSASAEEALPQ